MKDYKRAFEELTRIVEDAYAEELGTYDYDRIAEGVLELVEKYKKGDKND